MKNIFSGLLLGLFCLLFFSSKAQQIITTTKIQVEAKQPIDSLRELNALIFQPKGFKKVIHPPHYKLDSNGKFINIYNINQDIDSSINKAFSSAFIHFKNNDIFIGINNAWVTLSSFFKYQSDDTSKTINEAIENARIRANAGFINYKQDWRIGADTLLGTISPTAYKMLNADTAFVLGSKYLYKYNSATPNYKVIVIYLIKYDLGHVALLYFYPIGQEKKVFEAIKNTWGIVQFKPDSSFHSFTYENMIPKQTEPELYYGKFSFVNNPEELKREIEQYKQKRLRIKSQKIGTESVPLVHEKQYGAAKAKLREGLQIDTTNGSLYNQLIYVSLFQNETDSAWFFWHKYQIVEPHSFNLLLTKGMLQEASHQLDSAAVTYGNLLKSDSLNLLVYQKLIAVYSQQQHTEKIKQVLSKAIQSISIEERKKQNKQPYRILNNNQVGQIKIDYSKYWLAQREPDSCIAVLTLLVNDTEEQKKADTSGAKASNMLSQFKSTLNPKVLAECYFLIGLSYGMNHDNDAAKVNLLKAKALGWEIPDELKGIIGE